MTNLDLGLKKTNGIKIHSPEDYEGMRKIGKIAAQALDLLAAHVKPGISTDELDSIAFEFAMDHNTIPAPLHYRGFPKSICTSINHVVCHGIPGNKKLKDGDIINIDVTLILDGWHGDTSRMFPVGEVAQSSLDLIDTTYEALMRGIQVVKPGITTGDIGYAIQSFAEERGYSIVREFCGHGLGQVFHSAPNILHYGKPGEGDILREGMFFTVEPMINIGRPDVRILRDGWTAVTRDKSLSSQFEHSIAVTADGYEIFTQSPAGLHKPPFPPAS